jgi:hypothetical protein
MIGGRSLWRVRIGILLAVTLVIPVGCGGQDRQLYIERNEKLLGSFPVFPGAVPIAKDSHPYTIGDGGLFNQPDGYGTTVTYRLTRPSSGQEVGEFYLAEADAQWARNVEEIKGREPPGPQGERGPTIKIHFCKDQALASVDTRNVAVNSTYAIYVDHKFWRPPVTSRPC